MTYIKPLEEFTTIDLKKQIKKSFQDYNKLDLVENTIHIISLLAQLKPKHTFNFFKNIDNKFIGLSVSIIMEARHNNCNDQTQKDCFLLLSRLAYFVIFFPEEEIFSPSKKRLIHSLLFEENIHPQFLIDLKSSLLFLNNIMTFSTVDKKYLDKALLKVFFNHYSLTS